MMTLILGGSGSGKSGFAEEYLMQHASGRKKYYIATMQVYDEEMAQKVARHQRLRSDKGFQTIEQPVDVDRAADVMEGQSGVALLECLSNLTANEMFASDPPGNEEDISRKLFHDILKLKENVSHLVVVSNNVFEDGRIYDDTTMAYLRAMGQLHEKLAGKAEEVVEVVAGIPLWIKGGQNRQETERMEPCIF